MIGKADDVQGRADVPDDVKALVAALTAERDALLAPTEDQRRRLRDGIVAVAGSATLAAAMRQLLSAALDLTGLEAGGVYGVEGDWLVLRHHTGLPAAFVEQMRHMPLDSPVVQVALSEARPIDLVANCGPLAALRSRFGLICGYAAAIRARGEVVGFVNVASARQAAATGGGLEALCALAAEAGSVLLRFRAEEAALRDQSMLRGVLDAIPDAVFVKDTEGRYRAVNPAFERLTGHDAERILGATSAELFAPEVAARFGEVDAQVLADGCTRQVEDMVPDAHGGVSITETRKSPLRGEAGALIGVVGVSRDIRRRHRDQRLQEARLRLLELAQTHTLRQVLAATLDEAEALTGSRAGFYHFVDSEQGLLHLRAWSTQTLAECRMAGHDQSYPIAEAGVWADCITRGGPVVHNDFAAVQRRRALPDGHVKLQRELTVPVLRNGRAVAVLGVGNKPTDYDQDDVDTVAQLADMAWELAAWRQSEEARQTSERRLRLLIANVRDVLFELDVDARMTYLSQAVEGLLGYQPEELLGRRVWSLMVPEDQATEEQRARVAEACASSERVETRLVRRDGSRVWVEIIGSGTHDEQGQFLYVQGVARDITERKLAEQAMAESEARYRALVESSPEAIIVHRAGVILLANEAALALFGADDASQLVGEHVLNFVHPDMLPAVLARINALAAVQRVPAMDETLLRLDGSLIEAEVAAAQVMFDGQPAVQLVLRDVGERKLVERLLRATVEGTAQVTGMTFFGALATSLADAAGCAGGFVAELVDDRLRSLANCIDGRLALGFDLPLAQTPWRRVTEQGVLSVTGLSRDSSDAEVDEAPWCGRLDSFSAATLTDAAGLPLGLVAVWHDGAMLSATQIEPLLRICAARAAAELQRLRSLNELRHLVTAMDQAGESILITDAEGSIEYANPAFERLTGWRRDEVLGRRPSLLRSGEHGPDFYERLWQTIAAGSVWAGRIIDRHRDGHLITGDMTVAPVLDADGRIVRYVAVQRDISREMALEADLRQAQKMEAVGLLAGGIAHDLNNVLTPILGNAEIALDELGQGDPRREALAEIVSASHRARDLVKQLLAFGRRQTLVVQAVDLSDIVRRFEPLLRRALREDIELRVDLAEHPLSTRADRGQLEQVLLNLALNAQDAMPDGGRLTVRTEARRLAAGPGRLPAGDYVALTVADTGHGMDAATAERIFEPFFSTKGERGTGLGLATSLGIVQQHRGDLQVDSSPGQGTTFTIWLPASAAPAAAAPLRVEPASAGSGATVLVAEDEPSVRALACRMCRHLGYRVLTAETPEACLDLAGREPIDLLFTDVVMPGLNGHQLAEQVRASRPEVRVLLASGYARDVLGDRAQLGPRDGFIQKPYELADLAAALRRTLALP